MQTFAEYLLNERDLASKMEIVYYLSKINKVFFDKSIVLKTEILRMFLNYSKIEVDSNTILSACLLCNCKKVDNAQNLESVHTYAKKGAEYIQGLGFNKTFCKMCEEINRYGQSNSREKESDILELIDQFGGMLLDRPERIGFKPEEALVLLEHRNLKDCYNRYLETFIEFVNFMEKIEINDLVNMSALRRLVKIYNEEESLTNFIKKVVYEYEPKVDKLISNQLKEETNEMFEKIEDSNRPLFSKETAKKIMGHMDRKIEENKE